MATFDDNSDVQTSQYLLLLYPDLKPITLLAKFSLGTNLYRASLSTGKGQII